MSKTLLIVGGVAAAGIGGYFFWKYRKAREAEAGQGSIYSSQSGLTVPTNNSGPNVGSGPSAIDSAGAVLGGTAGGIVGSIYGGPLGGAVGSKVGAFAGPSALKSAITGAQSHVNSVVVATRQLGGGISQIASGNVTGGAASIAKSAITAGTAPITATVKSAKKLVSGLGSALGF